MSNLIIPQDKLFHFAAGFCIGICVYFIFSSIIAPVIGGLVGGIGKEALDFYQNTQREKKKLQPQHSVEVLDVLATVAGSIVAILIIYLFKGVIQWIYS